MILLRFRQLQSPVVKQLGLARDCDEFREISDEKDLKIYSDLDLLIRFKKVMNCDYVTDETGVFTLNLAP